MVVVLLLVLFVLGRRVVAIELALCWLRGVLLRLLFFVSFARIPRENSSYGCCRSLPMYLNIILGLGV